MSMSIPRRSHTREDWLSRKQLICQLYMQENRTLLDIQSILRSHGFDATERQYKGKLSQWNCRKKVTWDIWHAMFVVMQAEKRQCEFEVPKRFGFEIRRYTCDEVTKEFHRIEASKKWRKFREDGNLPEMDVAAAYHRLAEYNITVLSKKGSHCRQQVKNNSPRIHRTKSSSASATQTTEIPTADTNLESERFITEDVEDGMLLSDVSSTSSMNGYAVRRSSSEPDQRTTISTTSRQFGNLRPKYNSDAEGICLENRPRITYNDTEHRDLWKCFGETIRPGVEVSASNVSVSILNNQDDMRAFEISNVCEEFADDITNRFAGLIVGEVQSFAYREAWANFVGEAKPRATYSTEEVDALQWAAYYIQQCFAGWNTLDDWNHPDRLAAMSTFRRMLKSGNHLILLYVNWIVAVLGSHHKPQQLVAFLKDCCTEIDCLPSMTWKPVFDAILHFLHAVQVNDETEVATYGPRLREARDTIQHHYGSTSSNYLVISYQYAWYLMEQNEENEALSILRQCLPVSESRMGRRHLLTLNCVALMSRAYSTLDKSAQAIDLLKLAVSNRRMVPKPLQAYHYRLLKQLAELLMKADNLQDAESALCEVLDYRVQSFGYLVDTTWDSINTLCDNLRLQSRHSDADMCYQKHYDAYKLEHQETWIRHYGTEPRYSDSSPHSETLSGVVVTTADL